MEATENLLQDIRYAIRSLARTPAFALPVLAALTLGIRVAFIFREEVYKQDREDLKGTAELLLAKQRNLRSPPRTGGPRHLRALAAATVEHAQQNA